MQGIIFEAESIHGIEDGRKNMTRRVMKPQPELRKGLDLATLNNVVKENFWHWKDCQWLDGGIPPCRIVDRAPHKPGDTLYVKEAGCYMNAQYETHIGYNYCSGGFDEGGKCCNKKHYYFEGKVSPIYMPRKAARFFLWIKSVKVERVQDISEVDAKAEGVITNDAVKVSSYVYWYQQLWDKLNGKRDGGMYAWERNPWIWVYTFEQISKEEAERSDKQG